MNQVLKISPGETLPAASDTTVHPPTRQPANHEPWTLNPKP